MDLLSEGYKDKTVVVTGAASGMGAAVTKLLSSLGADVIGADIQEIPNPDIEGHKLDLLDEKVIDTFVSGLKDNSIYAVFACAGLPQTFPPADVVTVNFLGTRHLLEALLPKMTSAAAMSVITSLTIGWPQHIKALMPLINTQTMAEGREWIEANHETAGDSYIFSKEAMAAWITMKAPRWIQRGIRLNNLCPGITETPMLSKFYEVSAEALAMLPQPLNRPTTAEEQAFVMAFLNHPAASALVGHSLYNDGGSAAAIISAFASGIIPTPDE